MTQKECPRCEGALSVEQYACEDLAPRNQCTLLHCEFCGIGWETLWEKGPDGHFHEKFTMQFDKQKDPVEYGKFLQRLKDRRLAA